MKETTTMNVFQRLLEVQKEAKAPRTIDGQFGKARSAEQILEAYKPVCNQHGLYLTTSDEVHLEGERSYIKTTAMVINVDKPDEKFSASAEAWEGQIPQSKYGNDVIDSSQLTGKTSSYAKKYALQNLFAIDDTKDSDQNAGESEEDILPRAKKKINEVLIAQGYVEAKSKQSFISNVLEHNTINNLKEADLVMDALENEL